MSDRYELVHLPDQDRYELHEQGRALGYINTPMRAGAVSIPYIEIEPAHRGGNLGSILIRKTLDDIRGRGHKVIPICPFVVAFFRRNPDYRDLLLDESRVS
jgi:uncharacterized protein